MVTYVLVHGSSWGSWCWKEVARRLRATGHDAYTPSLTGLGERVHLASPTITLDTHILDVSNTLIYEELQDVVLVGLSYGGMVITGLAERLPERIAHLVFLDAPVPGDGESVCSLMGPAATITALDRARTEGDGWRFGGDGDPTAPQPGDPTRGRATRNPLQTWLQPLTVRNPAAAAIPRTYIRCTDRQWVSNPWLDSMAAMLERSAAMARTAGWGYHDLPTGHDAAILSAPQLLADLLLALGPAVAAPRE
jgi:pimeloyl-ACP methyl ester carboxylesterase